MQYLESKLFKINLFSSFSGSFLLAAETHYFNNTEAKSCDSPVDMDQSYPNTYHTPRIETNQTYPILKEKLPVICRFLKVTKHLVKFRFSSRRFLHRFL